MKPGQLVLYHRLIQFLEERDRWPERLTWW
jgi:hypothetical protein